jgi:sporulation protein YlmC with PRC-barrel domain
MGWILAAALPVIWMTPWSLAQEKKTETKTEVKSQTRDENGKLVGEEKNVTKTKSMDEGQDRKTFHERWYQPAHRWQKVSDLMGKTVKNNAGEKLGELGDMPIDVDAERIIYGVVEFGGFLGMGEKWFAVPWSALRLSDDDKTIMFDVSKDTLKNAQGFDKKGQWPNFGDERWATETHKYYNQPRYWETNEDKNGSYRATMRWQKASDLMKKDVKSMANNDKIGHINDIVVDPDTGRVMYAIVEVDDVKTTPDHKYAVPLNAMRLSDDFSHFTIDMDKAGFMKGTSFTGTNWPNFSDRNWATENASFYHTRVYWEHNDGHDTKVDVKTEHK